MMAPRSHILVALLIVCGLPVVSRRAPETALEAQELPTLTAPETEMDAQLRVNRTTLLEGKTDKSRMDAAGLLLFSDAPGARETLLEVLRRPDNPPARAAVCDVLNPVRVGQRPLKNREDFLRPLLSILLSEEDPAIARRAADATLIFGYSQVQPDLEKAVMDSSLSVNVRLNVVYALRRHPDKQAVAMLFQLQESPDAPVVEAARNSLIAMGIPVGQDPAARRQILADLQERGVEAFLRDRLFRQETMARELEADREAWQKRVLTALSGWHDALPSDAAKISFLAQQLTSSEVPVRSWALDKLLELRSAKGALKLSDLESTLSKLIADPSRQVRLRTARVLALMGELDTSKALLDQLRVEPDEQIKREILMALGESCYAGSMATAGRRVPDEIRKETLEWAERYLNDPDPEKTRSGAGVLGRLLEQNGFKPDDVERYLKALSARYTQLDPSADPARRAYLLGAMAGLCAGRSACREQAGTLYRGLFEQALTDKADNVRQAAVDGYINVDRPAALRKLRENNMAADPNPIIRQRLLDFAGEFGGPPDLDWLVERMGVAGESEPAWRAMLRVFGRSTLALWGDWPARIKAQTAAGRVTAEQRIAFLALMEQKAQGENRPDLAKEVQTDLAQLYFAGNNFKQAAEYLKIALAAAATEEQRQRVQSQLLRVHLGAGSLDLAAEMIDKCLSAKELNETENCVVKGIEESLNDPRTADPGALLTALQQIKLRDAEAARRWQALLNRLTDRFARARKPEDNNQVNN